MKIESEVLIAQENSKWSDDVHKDKYRFYPLDKSYQN